MYFMETQDYLNLFAGTTGLRTQDALNIYAGTSGLSKQACWNVLAGTTDLSSQAAANVWANTPDPSYLSIRECCEHMYDTGAYYRLNNVGATLSHNFANNTHHVAGSSTFNTLPFAPTRTSNATMILANGNMGWAPANLYTRSDVGDAGWSASSASNTIDSSVSSPTSTVVRKLVTNNGVTANANDSVGGVVAPTVTVVAGATYVISFYAKAAEISSVRVREPTVTGTRATVDLTTGTVAYESGSSSLTNMVVSSTDVGSGWRRITCTRTVSGTSQSINIKPGLTTGDGTLSPKAYNATAGAAYYGHRFDTNPSTLAARGLLCEPTATNLAPNSRNASYVGNTTFGTASAAPTPLLGFGGTRFTADGSANSHYIGTANTASAPASSTVHTISAYVKAGTTTLVQLIAPTAFAGATVYANFDLSAGTVGSVGAGASNVTIIDNGNGVYRLALTFTSIAGAAAGSAVIVAAISATTDTRLPAFATSGTFDVMGLQLETSVAYTSLIPTYGVSAVRASESFNSAVGISGWFDNTKGVMYAEYEVYAAGSRSDHLFTIGKTSFTSTNDVLTFISGFGTPLSRRFDAWVAGVNQASSLTNDALGVVAKVAGRYNSSTTTIKGFKNGAAAGTNSAAPIPTSLDRYFLTATGYTSESGIWVKAIRYYPSDTASDAQMLTLTT
jgi:hypothetical protein